MSALADYFAMVLRGGGVAAKFQREFRFHPTRKWRFDFADPVNKIAVEIDGGVFMQGRHSRGAGYRSDCEKFNAAAVLGWRVFRYVQRNGMGSFLKDYAEAVNRTTTREQP